MLSHNDIMVIELEQTQEDLGKLRCALLETLGGKWIDSRASDETIIEELNRRFSLVATVLEEAKDQLNFIDTIREIQVFSSVPVVARIDYLLSLLKKGK